MVDGDWQLLCIDGGSTVVILGDEEWGAASLAYNGQDGLFVVDSDKLWFLLSLKWKWLFMVTS